MARKITARDGERGSALLLTLGILSLILVLAMGFAYSANTSLRVAKVQGAANDARTIVDGAVDTLLADMQYMFADRGTGGVATKIHLYPAEDLNMQNHTSDSASMQQHLITFQRYENSSQTERQNFMVSRDWWRNNTPSSDENEDLEQLLSLDQATAADGLAYLPQLRVLADTINPTSSATGVADQKVSFAPPLTVDYSLTDGGNPRQTTKVNKAIGRYAYIVLEESNKLDINSAISLSGRFPSAVDKPAGKNPYVGGDFCDRLVGVRDYKEVAPTEGYYGFNIFKTAPTVAVTRYLEDSTIRMGLLPEEIMVDNDYVTALRTLTSGPYIDSTLGWESYRQMWDCLSSTYRPASGVAGTSDMMTYTFFGGTDRESYFDTPSGGTETEYARFDLTGSSWGLSKPAEITPDMVNVNTLALKTELTGWRVDTKGSAATINAANRKLVRNLCGYETGDDLNADPTRSLQTFEKTKITPGENAGDPDVTEIVPNYSGQAWADGEGYIDWLHRMVGGGQKVGIQVAANIKDYSDADNFATCETDTGVLTPADATTAFPKVLYCGNERVQYINEIIFANNVYGALDAEKGHYVYTLELYGGAELLNIYATGTSDAGVLPGDVTIRARVKLKVYKQQFEVNELGELIQDADGNDKKIGEPIEWTAGEPLDTSQTNFVEFSSASKEAKDFSGDPLKWDSLEKIKSLGYNSFSDKVNLKLSQKLLDDIELSGQEYRHIFRFVITDVQVFSLEKDTVADNDDERFSKLYDIAVVPHNDTSYTDDFPDDRKILHPESDTQNTSFSGLIEKGFGIVGFQCIDSRCNHLETSWNPKTKKSYKEKISHRMNSDNEGAFAEGKTGGDSVDMEPVVTFGVGTGTTYSTAFIRNAPMQSLWELGAIHRGQPDQTINLKKYTPVSGDDTVDYTQGDGGILEQVKIGPLMYVKGKINVNQRNPRLWKLLFERCGVTKKGERGYVWYDRDTVPVSGFHDEKNTWGLDVNKIKSTVFAGSKSSKSRTEKLYELLGTSGLIQAQNDRDYEAFAGRTAQLLGIRNEAFSLLVAAESLQELDIDSTGFNAIKSTLQNPVEVRVSMKEKKSSSGATTYDIKHRDAYCTVTGHQKVLLHVIRDSNDNTFKVISKQYLED